MNNTDKEINDLTIVYLTANEHPSHWIDYQWEIFKKAAWNYPVIYSSLHPATLDFKPDWGSSFQTILQTEEYSHYSMYRQLLRAAKMATTPYIAVAESDVLYSPEHFTFFRPKMNEVAYDMSKWSLYTWRPVFTMKRRKCNAFMIAPREYLIQALEERYGDNPLIPAEKSKTRVGEIGRHIHEDGLGIPRKNAVEVYCYHPSVVLLHPNAIGIKQADHPFKKTLGEMKALEIPVWGKAEDLVKEYR